MTSTIETYFGELPDPRESNIRHPLVNIMTITICAVICGADSWTDVEMFGEAKQGWLSTFLDLKHGIPSHDTIGRLFRALDADLFSDRFMAWTQHLCEIMSGEVIAVDGKQLKGSKDSSLGKDGIYMVNVWASANQLSLATRQVDEKTNEITVIPELVKLLDIKDSIVTLDAMNCQTTIAATIRQQDADYVMSVKANQGTLLDDVKASFKANDATEPSYYYATTTHKGHGRIDRRMCWIVDDEAIMAYIHEHQPWQDLKTIVKLTSERHLLTQDKVEQQTRYFISSHTASAADFLNIIRAHWQVENSLHWVLDIAFREDESRVRKDHAPQNFAVLRQLALNLLKRDTSLKVGISAKRKRAGWDHDYLHHILCSAQ